MGLHRVVVSFTTYVEAEDTEGVDEQINGLLDELGKVDTKLSWDWCDWETYFVLEEAK
jgi:hypothetical protein